MDSNVTWQTYAELAGLVDANGLLGSDRIGGMPTPGALIPHGLHVTESHLVWGIEWPEEVWAMLERLQTEGRWSQLYEAERRLVGRTASPTGALGHFASISNAQDVLRYAKRYGPLWLCPHGRPSGHPVGGDQYPNGAPLEIRALAAAFGSPPGYERCPVSRTEPLAVWFRYVAEAKKMLEGLAQIRNSDDMPDDELSMLRASLALAVDLWITDANLHPHLSWGRESSPELKLSGNVGFGMLATQLLATVSGSADLATCQACGQPYLPRRKPQSGRSNFCRRIECQRFADTQRKRRHRQKKGEGP